MPGLTLDPPPSPAEPVTEILHGVPITDPYRWLEDQNSPRTRAWIEEQTRYARANLDSILGRERIRQRVREFLEVETFDSLQKVGNCCFFRKRLPRQEQACIYMRQGAGPDQLLIDPAEHGTGKNTAVKPLRVSPDKRLLLYEIKEGGERTGTFALFDTVNRKTLPDILSRGYLRGFAFAPDGKSFCYVHEALDSSRPFHRAAYCHVIGTTFTEDREVFCAGDNERLRLCLIASAKQFGFLVYKFVEKTRIDFYLASLESRDTTTLILQDADYMFGPVLLGERILAITDRGAPNLRIVELFPRSNRETEWVTLIPERDSRIQQWAVSQDRIVVSYVWKTQTKIFLFDLCGREAGNMPVRGDETVRLLGVSTEGDELLFEKESFTEPIGIFRYHIGTGKPTLWFQREVPFDSANYKHCQVWYPAKDGTQLPMFLVGREEILAEGTHPTIMTSYGGHGVCMTPQFSVFVAFLIERGCLFALPNIRGGSEFGADWHTAARRRNRQTAFDDFLAAGEWLLRTGQTVPGKLAIFGGSNSGLLVGAAMTQRPDLFRAVVCMVPLLDMLRYHLFDNAHVWRDEFGTAEDPDDFLALASYSPYQQVRPGTKYPATMIISGDADRNCNPLHARKMTARLQRANTSGHPILLDYSPVRGHSPVLPLTDRVEGLTDRLAFLCDQLQLPV